MAVKLSPKQELLAELSELRARLEETEGILRAIRQGEVDAREVFGPESEQIFTLKGADHDYHIIVETINEGTATMLAADNTMVYVNQILAKLLRVPPGNANRIILL